MSMFSQLFNGLGYKVFSVLTFSAPLNDSPEEQITTGGSQPSLGRKAKGNLERAMEWWWHSEQIHNALLFSNITAPKWDLTVLCLLVHQSGTGLLLGCDQEVTVSQRKFFSCER